MNNQNYENPTANVGKVIKVIKVGKVKSCMLNVECCMLFKFKSFKFNISCFFC